MGKKIITLEDARILVDGGRGEIHIQESSDGIFNIEIIENVACIFRLGSRTPEGIIFEFIKGG